MTFVLGVDPGNTGAFAVYDTEAQRVFDIKDMPTWFQAVGKRNRKRIDAIALADMMDTYELLGVKLMVMEAVGGRPRQGASSAFVFGYGVGLIYMAGLYSRIPLETVTPGTWKKIMNVPGKKNAEPGAIMQRAYELFPNDRDWFKGPQGGVKMDRAEAAMLAKFGGDHVLRVAGRVPDQENLLAFRNADTGA